MPKVELHLHLDCSLSYEVVNKIDPSITEEIYRHDFIAPAKCLDLARLQHQHGKACSAQMLHHATFIPAGRLDADARYAGLG